MDLRQRALDCLARDRVFYADMLESLRRGTGELLYGAGDGVLLYETAGEVYMMTAHTPAAAERCFARIPSCGLLVGHELWYRQAAADRFGLTVETICYQSAWPEGAPPPEPEIPLIPLGQELAPWIYDRYSQRFGSVDYIREAIRRGMLGAVLEGELAGFIGTHPEGSIGILEVLPPFRRRGVGEALLRGAVRLALERGAIPYGQVEQHNAASLALQRKAGMAVSDRRLFWLL